MNEAWAYVLARVSASSHLATGGGLSAMADDAVAAVGLSAEVLLVDLAQQTLSPVHRGRHALALGQLEVDNSLAGRAYQLTEILAGHDQQGGRVLWVPMLDGTERAGVVRFGLSEDTIDDDGLRWWMWTLSGLLGHITMTKLGHSERLRRLRSNGPLTPAAELLWQLLPARTFAAEHVVVSALLEPYDSAAGDAYDYRADGDSLDLAVFDGVGHDLGSGIATALALTGVRAARRDGVRDLLSLAAHADRLVATQAWQRRFVTAVLARLDTRLGLLRYLNLGHPPPLLVRRGHVVKQLPAPPRVPLGVTPPPGQPGVVGEEQLEPGDRLLFYTDGITEARNAEGDMFGEQRLVEFTERAAAADLSAPETLRRLSIAVQAFQHGRMRDDATLVMLDWTDSQQNHLLPRALLRRDGLGDERSEPRWPAATGR